MNAANVMAHPSESFTGRLKSNLLWKIGVEALSPLFVWFWKNLLHPQARLLYLLGEYRGVCSHELKSRAFECYEAVPEFVTFAQWLRKQIPDGLLNQAREKLLACKDEGAFTETLDLALSEETRIALLKFAQSPEVLKRVIPYFGLIPRIDTVFVMFNIPRPELGGPEGSQRWHRDGDIYKMLSLYVCLTDLDENSGLYSAVTESSLKYRQAVPIEVVDSGQSLWKNGRHSDEYLKKYVPETEWVSLKGPVGTAALVDSASCYHKGGFCKQRERLLLQINYIADQTHTRRSILDVLGLRTHPKSKDFLDDAVKCALLRPNSGRMGRFVFAIVRRLLTYYVSPRSL